MKSKITAIGTILIILVSMAVGSALTEYKSAIAQEPTKISYALVMTNQDSVFLDGRDSVHGAVQHYNGVDLIISKGQYIQVVYPANDAGFYQIGPLTYKELFTTFPVLNNHVPATGAFWINAKFVDVVTSPYTPTSPSIITPTAFVETSTPVPAVTEELPYFIVKISPITIEIFKP